MNRIGGFKPQRLGDDAVRDRVASKRRLRLIVSVAAGIGVTLVFAYAWSLKIERAFGERVEALEQENRRLGEELSVGRLALEMEQATRAELERQLTELNDKLKRREAELEFLQSRPADKSR